MKSFDRQVADWARTKPADEAYEYDSVTNCALCRFLRETGLAVRPLVGGNRWSEDDADTGWTDFPVDLDTAARTHPWTFGALADRLSA